MRYRFNHHNLVFVNAVDFTSPRSIDEVASLLREGQTQFLRTFSHSIEVNPDLHPATAYLRARSNWLRTSTTLVAQFTETNGGVSVQAYAGLDKFSFWVQAVTQAAVLLSFIAATLQTPVFFIFLLVFIGVVFISMSFQLRVRFDMLKVFQQDF
jgi:hypothetical protein